MDMNMVIMDTIMDITDITMDMMMICTDTTKSLPVNGLKKLILHLNLSQKLYLQNQSRKKKLNRNAEARVMDMNMDTDMERVMDTAMVRKNMPMLRVMNLNLQSRKRQYLGTNLY